MRTYLFGLIGLALLCGGPLLGDAPTATPCNSAACGATACGAATCGGETGCNSCNSCSNCCPKCGCRLVPVCHVYCAPKKVTKHEYTCLCEDICIPGCSCCCNHCRNCGCDNGNNGCQEGCGCGCGGKCLVRDVSRLVIHPVVTEVPVKKCTVEWVCPHCGCSACEQCGSTPAGLCQPNAK